MFFNTKPNETFKAETNKTSNKKKDRNNSQKATTWLTYIFGSKKNHLQQLKLLFIQNSLIMSPKRLIFASVKLIKPHSLHLPYFTKNAFISWAVFLVLFFLVLVFLIRLQYNANLQISTQNYCLGIIALTFSRLERLL